MLNKYMRILSSVSVIFCAIMLFAGYIAALRCYPPFAIIGGYVNTLQKADILVSLLIPLSAAVICAAAMNFAIKKLRTETLVMLAVQPIICAAAVFMMHVSLSAWNPFEFLTPTWVVYSFGSLSFALIPVTVQILVRDVFPAPKAGKILRGHFFAQCFFTAVFILISALMLYIFTVGGFGTLVLPFLYLTPVLSLNCAAALYFNSYTRCIPRYSAAIMYFAACTGGLYSILYNISGISYILAVLQTAAFAASALIYIVGEVCKFRKKHSDKSIAN